MPTLPDLLIRCMHAARIDSTGATLHNNILSTSDGSTYFARVVRGSEKAQARGEAEGLVHMRITCDIAPKLYRWTETADGKEAAIISDYFDLGRLGEGEQRELARGLARMHRTREEVGREGEGESESEGDGNRDRGYESCGLTESKLPDTPMYGFPVPTHCGVTELDNTWEEDWATFFRERRLGDMVQRLGDTEVDQEWEQMQRSTLPLLLENISPPPKPVILHGDLWSGNVGTDRKTGKTETGRAVIFDPAAYYGHNEADLGVMHMFGGFSSTFFDEYHNHHPKSSPHYDQRIKLYELFHHLNHALMFGGGYKRGAVGIMKDLNRYAEQHESIED